MIRVVVAEDQPDVREALSELVASVEGFQVVGTAADAHEAIGIAEEHRPDVALVDVRMPRGGGPEAARGIRRRSPDTAIIALTAYDDRATVLRMLQAGASGYIVKGTASAEVIDALRWAARGESTLSRQVTSEVVRGLAELLERSERQRDRLEELDRNKSELIQVLSHELLTPATIIMGTARTLAESRGQISVRDAAELADGVMAASDRMRRLIGNLDAAARVGTMDDGVDLDPVEIAELLSSAAAELPRSGDRLMLPTDVGCRVLANRELGERALTAVLENALQLSPNGSPVEVSVEKTDDYVVVRISDRGPGVPPEARARIFEPFVQADSTTTRSHPGVGIGLYLARRVMEAHGGGLAVEPREGGGSTFLLTFAAA